MNSLSRLLKYGAIAGAMSASFAGGYYFQNPPELRHLHAATADIVGSRLLCFHFFHSFLSSPQNFITKSTNGVNCSLH
ncbi:unnamed protein product [Anisakis simplex]|uniref:Transmembrane protein 256 n=1 Tax=Anisakis simplex TaxID=6269 RepID=A0A0M3JJ23_ANISI|nr:unnamed protein product [Anisakis simplex]